jgi:hypothetical protein
MTAFMAVVFVLIFASGAWFAPMWRRGERDRFGVSMLGCFLLLFVAIQDEAVSPVRAVLAACLTTMMIGGGAILMARRSGTDTSSR